METKRVKSANKYYIIMSIIYFILTITLIVVVIYSAKTNIKNLFMLVFPLPIVFLITISEGKALIDAYKRKSEFDIYIIKKDGIINFTELNKEYIQIGDQYGDLYFVKKEDYKVYLDYNLTHSFR